MTTYIITKDYNWIKETVTTEYALAWLKLELEDMQKDWFDVITWDYETNEYELELWEDSVVYSINELSNIVL